jgi:hypothetical protein
VNCPCGFPPSEHVKTYSPAWHRAHQTWHLTTFPDVDTRTRDNLELLIAWSEATP